MTTPDIMARLLADMAEAAAHPEGTEVLVVGTDSPEAASKVAPMLARVLLPGRTFGDVLHIEPGPSGTWAVVVRDIGPTFLHTRGAMPVPTR